jgi:hypothetical protein
MTNETPTAKFTREDGWPQGLYVRSSIYYSRYSLNGSRTFRSLDTDNFAVAKLRLAKLMGSVEQDRQKGLTIDGDLRTLGGLTNLLKK